ncbi:cytochrome P450 [Sphaerisporangium dianthi]|uniref:Cytochrome P450 n=1 Tax=Sphaerisporangium dianthi TaxID=1436120 RepID=A0ABV9CJF4_9ACTN
MDPPDHGRQRRLVSKAFTPRITARYEPWIRGIVDDLLDGLQDGPHDGHGLQDGPHDGHGLQDGPHDGHGLQDGPHDGRAAAGPGEYGSFDAVRDFAAKLSMRTIGELMDIPAGDLDMLKEWSDELALATEVPTLVAAFRSLDVFSPEELAGFGRASVAIHAYFADLIHKRRTHPGEDLISSLIQAEDQGRTLARHEVTNVLATLFAAAHESVTNLVANGLLALSRNPGQLAALREDPSIAPLLVDEVLRYDAPVQLTARVALGPTRLGPAAVEPGAIVILLLAAAGRDEAAYPRAGDFLAGRRAKGIGLAFGAGAHYCIGSSLARLEAAIAFTAIAERLTAFEVEEESLAYRRHVVVRGPRQMTVRHRR